LRLTHQVFLLQNYYYFYLFIDSSLLPPGNVYIGDWYNHRIRKVTVSTGIITTVAGTGTSSYSGDNGPATSAALNYPNGVSLDASGNDSCIVISVRHCM
jgi:hypothetical protein